LNARAAFKTVHDLAFFASATWTQLFGTAFLGTE
jgi:hypothetical protein